MLCYPSVNNATSILNVSVYIQDRQYDVYITYQRLTGLKSSENQVIATWYIVAASQVIPVQLSVSGNTFAVKLSLVTAFIFVGIK